MAVTTVTAALLLSSHDAVKEKPSGLETGQEQTELNFNHHKQGVTLCPSHQEHGYEIK